MRRRNDYDSKAARSCKRLNTTLPFRAPVAVLIIITTILLETSWAFCPASRQTKQIPSAVRRQRFPVKEPTRPLPLTSSSRTQVLQRNLGQEWSLFPRGTVESGASFRVHNNKKGCYERNHRRKRWIGFLLFLVAATFFPKYALGGATSAASLTPNTAKAAAITAAATPLTYSSNPAISTLAIGPPLSKMAELRVTGRLLIAAALGAGVGKERSGKPHHAAGVRTMSLVAMGAAAFTVCSMYGFTSAGRYDPSRMASNVASGVGFIGAGVITTSSNNRNTNIVHGLTTAAAIWISAAIGVVCGAGLYYIASVAALCTVTILRVGEIKKKNRKATMRGGKQMPTTLKNEYSNSDYTTLRIRKDELVKDREDQLVYEQKLSRGYNESDISGDAMAT